MGEVFAGRYELVDPIGRGGVGAVWRAWDHRRRRYVAAKVLQQRDAHALLRFVREQALRIDHPHVLAPASWAADDDQVLFTMDLVAGGSLVHLVNDYGPLPPGFVCTLLDQLLAGLAAVHAEGVVHRDVKPANLLLEATGTARPRLRLSDFGIAMRLGEPRLTDTNLVVGTPGYIAPEQMLGAEPDFTADLFAVGLVALYLLEGAKPDTKALVQYFAAHGTPSAPKGIPEPLWQVVASLLQPDPQARFRTATGARKALAAAVELLPEPGPDDELIEIFDQLGPLPPGFAPDGPLQRAPGVETTTKSSRTGGGPGTVGGSRSSSGVEGDGWGGGALGDGGVSERRGGSDRGGDGQDGSDGSDTGDGGGSGDAGALDGGSGVGGGVGGAYPAGAGSGGGAGSGDDSSYVDDSSYGAGGGHGADMSSGAGVGYGTNAAFGTGAGHGSNAVSRAGAGTSEGSAGGWGNGVGGWGGTGNGVAPAQGTPGRAAETSPPSSVPRPTHPVSDPAGAAAGHADYSDAGRSTPPPADGVGATPGSPLHSPGRPFTPPHGTEPSTPSQPNSMSDTGSFHLPPPQATGSTPRAQTQFPQSRPPQTPPQAEGQPHPHQGPPHQSPHFAPHDLTHALSSPRSVAPHYPAHPPTAAPHRSNEPSTLSYTAQAPRVPPPAQAISQPRHRARRAARRRSGPPAKVAIPILLLALACYAVGFWALTQL
ncbi:serine/threonine-protein kinase [Streptomyces sp. YU58]|uniref:serine/threonine-protein kinase n=1 Tax=Streptomyces sp. SX92 TaxID=3158972 RepID=UPI0027B9E7CD|nr:serine/threonine-protein kinase [Streptomyces coralus]WLW53681.1 protein kinase [Streptomyces coralus]